MNERGGGSLPTDGLNKVQNPTTQTRSDRLYEITWISFKGCSWSVMGDGFRTCRRVELDVHRVLWLFTNWFCRNRCFCQFAVFWFDHEAVDGPLRRGCDGLGSCPQSSWGVAVGWGVRPQSMLMLIKLRMGLTDWCNRVPVEMVVAICSHEAELQLQNLSFAALSSFLKWKTEAIYIYA